MTNLKCRTYQPVSLVKEENIAKALEMNGLQTAAMSGITARRQPPIRKIPGVIQGTTAREVQRRCSRVWLECTVIYPSLDTRVASVKQVIIALTALCQKQRYLVQVATTVAEEAPYLRHAHLAHTYQAQEHITLVNALIAPLVITVTIPECHLMVPLVGKATTALLVKMSSTRQCIFAQKGIIVKKASHCQDDALMARTKITRDRYHARNVRLVIIVIIHTRQLSRLLV